MFKKILLVGYLSHIISVCYSQSNQLSFFIQQGLQNSPQLKDYANQIQSATIDSSLLNAQRKPQLNAVSMVMVAPAINGIGYDEAITNTGNYTAQVNVSQSVFNRKIYKPQYESISIKKQSIANTSKLSEHDLKKSITDQYVVAYNSLKQVDYTKATLNLLNEAILSKSYRLS